MENHRLRVLTIIAVLIAFTAAPVFATGGWDEEEPATLDTYLDRLPAKSLGQIFEETAPRWVPVSQPDVAKVLKAIATDAKTKPVEKLIAQIDSLIRTLRSEQARAQAAATDKPLLPSRDLNLLHDVRDALAAAGPEAADYIVWRVDSDALIQPTVVEPDRIRGWEQKSPEAPNALTSDLEKRLEEAKGPMRAQWLYLCGAVAFRYSDKKGALFWFDKVLEEYPQHPRAEAALLMRGRCLLSESRNGGYGYNDKRIKDSGIHDQALNSFLQYVKQYPQGRFVADARGWLGGLAWDEEDYLKALDWYIQQAETPDHPEVLKSSVLMIEKTLRRLAAAENQDAAFALVARHPKVAMSMLYLLLGSPDAAHRAFDWKDPQNVVDEKIRQWRGALLPRLASAVAAQKKAYAGDAWQPRYLAILVHASSNAGRQEEALRLAALAPNAEQNDDLLFAKAVAVQRSGKAAEAIPVFRLFLKKFESSPLAPGARIRLALALRDHHEAGMAIVELKKLHNEKPERGGGILYEDLISADYELAFTDPVIYEDISDAEADQVNQLISTLLTFAPLPELKAGLIAGGIDPGFSADLRGIIARRALFHEDFKTAREMMTPAQYALDATNLEQLTGAAAKPSKDKALEKAGREMRVGDAWAAVAQKPLLTDQALARSDLDRRTNARALGITDPDSELESCYPLVHAWHWWLMAARTAPGSAVSAAARLKVLEAMATLAKSDYGLTRAVEDDWSHASRQIYDRLQTECPHSNEAKQAAWWNFALPQGSENENRERYNLGYESDSGAESIRPGYAGYRWSDFGALGGEKEDWSGRGGGENVISRRMAALRATTWDLPALKKEVGELRWLVPNSETACLNCLEDLVIFMGEPGLTPEIAQAYTNLRLDVLARSLWGDSSVKVDLVSIPADADDADAIVRTRIAEALKDPKMKAVGDYLEFLDAAMVANHQVRVPCRGKNDKGEPDTYSSRDYPALEKMMRTFLKRYPHSQKREAARLLLARAVFRQSWPRFASNNPSADAPDEQPNQYEPFKPKRVLTPLDDYDKEFPKGRYSADIRDMRAGVFWRMGDWRPALKLTLAQWNEGAPGLEFDAALRLANIFAELAKPENRPGLLAAIREYPDAVECLKSYLAKAQNYREHPLRFQGGYLQEQLGFKLPPSNEKK